MESVRQYLMRGPSSSKEIQSATGLSQSSVYRTIRQMGDAVISVQKGRTIKYAATCNAFGVNDKIALGTVDKAGQCHKIGYIRPLNCGYFFLEPESNALPSMLLGDEGSGLYEDLPFFLFDLRPQGFLGRQTVKMISAQNANFPSDPQKWNTDHIGRYLIYNGEDLPGNLIVGDQMFLKPRQKPFPVSSAQYPQWAEKILKGEVPGSSAGGEQPKFAVFNEEKASHVIVKFSPKGKDSVAQRWKDILITEFHASKILREYGYPAATLELFQTDGRLFLESKRFDRQGEFGRSSMISLDVLDREFAGTANNRGKVVDQLFSKGMVKQKDVNIIKELHYFGILINNTDMHLGNLSFAIENDSLSLRPVYDMCSMGFAPKSGEVLAFEFQCTHGLKPEPDMAFGPIRQVRGMADDFWNCLARDTRLSDEFRTYLQQANPIDTPDKTIKLE